METAIESTPVVEQMLEHLRLDQRPATAYEKAAYATADRCYDMSPTGGWTCTMAKGHVGNHTAHVSSGDHVCGTWTNSTTSPKLAELQAALDEMTAHKYRAVEEYRSVQNAYNNVVADFNIVGNELQTEAINRGWCSDYDQFINRVNDLLHSSSLPNRNKDYRVTRTITVTVNRTVSASDEENAMDDATFDGWVELRSSNWSIDDWNEDTDEANCELDN